MIPPDDAADRKLQKAVAKALAKATTYSPGKNAMEGGLLAARRGPDGRREVATVKEYMDGKVPYVTVAGDRRFMGRQGYFPELPVKIGGKTVTLTNVPFVQHDTGGAFRNAGPDRLDVPVAHGMTNKEMATQPYAAKGLFYVNGPAPFGGGTRFASAGASDAPTNVGPFRNAQGESPVRVVNVNGAKLDALSPRAQSLVEKLRTAQGLPDLRVISAYRDPGYNAKVGGAKGSQHVHGNALDFDVSGWTEAQKSAFLMAAADAGAKGVGLYPSGNSIHLDVRDTPATWGPSSAGAYKGVDIAAQPAWARPALEKIFGTASTPQATAYAPTGGPQNEGMGRREALQPVPRPSPTAYAYASTPGPSAGGKAIDNAMGGTTPRRDGRNVDYFMDRSQSAQGEWTPFLTEYAPKNPGMGPPMAQPLDAPKAPAPLARAPSPSPTPGPQTSSYVRPSEGPDMDPGKLVPPPGPDGIGALGVARDFGGVAKGMAGAVGDSALGQALAARLRGPAPVTAAKTPAGMTPFGRLLMMLGGP